MKIRAVFLTVLLALSILAVGLSGSAAAQTTSNTPDCSTVGYSGDGTSTNPYEVGNVAQLHCIEDQGLSADYELVSDIDASGTQYWETSSFSELRDQVYTAPDQFDLFHAPVEPGSISVTDLADGSSVSFNLIDAQAGTIEITEETNDEIMVSYRTQTAVNVGFDPIGTDVSRASTPFTGSFYGNDHTITGLTINRTNAETDLGLFGATGSGATVRNVTVSGLDIDHATPADYKNRFPDVGGLVGENAGTIRNASVSGTINRTNGSGMGGLVGYNAGTIDDSSASVTLWAPPGRGRPVGGLVSSNAGVISDSNASGDVYGYYSVGGLVGEMPCCGTSTVTNSSASGDVIGTGSSSRVGGLVGNSDGVVEFSYATGNVSGEEDVGGLVGHNTEIINDSYATGAVSGRYEVGGLVGKDQYGRGIRRSYATGPVSGDEEVGGLIGSALGDVYNSYWDEETTGQTSSDGGTGVTGLLTIQMTGDNARDAMSGFDFSTTWDVVQRDTADGTEVSYPYLVDNRQTPEPGLQTVSNTSDFSVTITSVNSTVQPFEIVVVDATITNGGRAAGTQTIEFTVNGSVEGSQSVTLNSLESTGVQFSYATSDADKPGLAVAVASENDTATAAVDVQEEPEPVCRVVGYAGSGTDADPYQVTNASQLQCMESVGSDGHFVMTSDINASNTSAWYNGAGFDPVGSSSSPFTGTFDGDGHTITDLTIDRSNTDYVGLFGRLGGTVRNVTLLNASVTGGRSTGGLVGRSSGTIERTSATGTVDGGSNDHVGGLVGTVDGGTVSLSHASVAVSGDAQVGGLVGRTVSGGSVVGSYATGDVSGDNDLGGLVGEQRDGSVRFSYATGAVTGPSGSADIGGLVGYNNGGSVTDSYATGAVSGDVDVGGLVGENEGDVSDAYAAGDVSGTEVGGLVGENDNTGTIAGSYWDVVASGQTSATSSNDGTVESSVVGFDTPDGQGRAAEMVGDNAPGNMTALDFESVWATRTGDYPTFLYRVGDAPPIAEDDTFIAEGNLSQGAPGVLGNDFDLAGDTITATSVVTGPTNGSVTLDADGSFEYVPDAGFTGRDGFTYEVSDGNNAVTANVSIFVAEPRGGPVREVSDHEWTSWHGQPENNNFNATIDGPRQPVTRQWNTAFPDSGCCVPMRPLVVNDTVFAFSYESTFAMDARNGSLLWSNASVQGTYLGGIAYEEGRLFVSSYDGNFYALHATNGTGIWSRSIGTDHTAPVTLDGTVFIADDSSTMYALDAETGDSIWEFTYQSAGYPADYASTTAVNGRVFVPLSNGTLVAHDADTGDVLWTQYTGYSESTPAVVDGTLYISDSGSAPYMHAIDAATGEFVWNATAEYSYTGVSVTEEMVYVATCGDSMFAYDADTGDLEWSRSGIGCAYDVSEPVTVGNFVYATNYDAETLALNRYTGETMFTITNPTGYKFTSPTPYRGVLYFADRYDSGGISAYAGPERPFLNPDLATTGTDTTLTVLQEYRDETVANATLTIEQTGDTLDTGPDGVASYEFPSTGIYDVTITAEDTTIHDYVETTREVEVVPPANFSVVIDDASQQVIEGGTVRVTATVTNTDSVRSARTVTLSLGGTQRDAETVTLDGGASTTITLTWETATGDAGSYGATVDTGTDTTSTPVSVVEPARIAATIDSTTSPVVAGDTLDVTATLENVGGVGTSQAVGLTVDGILQETRTVELGAGESTTSTFSWDTSGDTAPGEYEVRVVANDPDSAGSGDNETVRVVETANPIFDVAITGTGSPVLAGDTLDVTAVIENTGLSNGTQTVSLSVNGTERDNASVSLGPGESTSVTLSWATGTDDVGSYTSTVASANNSASTDVRVTNETPPAEFDVVVDSTTSPVTEGDTLDVTAVVENTGTANGTQTVSLSVNGTERDNTSVALDGGENTSVTLSWMTDDGDAGNYTATVASENDSASTDVRVVPPAPASFEVAIDSTTSPVTEGDRLAVTAEVNNTGDGAGTQTLALSVNGTERDAVSVSLGPGENATVTLTWTTAEGDAGNYTASVASDDDSDSTDVQVRNDTGPEAATFEVTIDSTSSPVTEGDTLRVTAVVENRGDESGTQRVTLSVNGTERDAALVGVAGGGTMSVTLSWATEEGDAGNYTASVASDDDSASAEVDVETEDDDGETGPGGPGQGDDGQPPVVEQYTNETGAVDTTGLANALDDWQNGTINTRQLVAVIEAWGGGNGNQGGNRGQGQGQRQVRTPARDSTQVRTFG